MKYLPLMLMSLVLLLPGSGRADTADDRPYAEIAFLKQFSGKNADYVRSQLGKPDTVTARENDGGKVEFWVYRDLVRQGSSDKTYRYTQIGIVNDAVETLGHTNRDVE